MRDKQVIEQEYQQVALQLGHLHLQDEAIKNARAGLMQKISDLRAEFAEVVKVEAELEARKKAEAPAEAVVEEAK